MWSSFRPSPGGSVFDVRSSSTRVQPLMVPIPVPVQVTPAPVPPQAKNAFSALHQSNVWTSYAVCVSCNFETRLTVQKKHLKMFVLPATHHAMERSSHPPKCSCARFLLFLVNCLRVVLRLLSPLTCLADPFVDPFQMTVEAASLGIAKDLISVQHILGGNVTFCDSVSSCPVPMHSKFNLTCCSSSSFSGSTTFRLCQFF